MTTSIETPSLREPVTVKTEVFCSLLFLKLSVIRNSLLIGFKWISLAVSKSLKHHKVVAGRWKFESCKFCEFCFNAVCLTCAVCGVTQYDLFVANSKNCYFCSKLHGEVWIIDFIPLVYHQSVMFYFIFTSYIMSYHSTFLEDIVCLILILIIHSL